MANDAKRRLREQIRLLAQQHDRAELHALSQKTILSFVQSVSFQRVQSVFCFLSCFRWEADTMPIVRAALKTGKTLSIPRIFPESGTIIACPVSSLDGLVKNKMGVREPIGLESADPAGIDLVIVPGMAFTKNGKRLGVGGGYYDRFLKNGPEYTVAFAFDFQLMDDLPIEDHDVSVTKVITIEPPSTPSAVFP